MVFYILAKFFFLILIVIGLFLISYYFRTEIGDDIILYFLLPITILLLNYTFFKLIFGLIFYYNDLVIFLKDKIIIVKSSLFLQDDLEIIDVSKVMKIDVQIHGFFANLLGYGNLIIEQQREEIRTLHFVPRPYMALQMLREKTAYLNIGQDMSFFKLN